MTGAPDTAEIFEQLGRLLRQLTRIAGGAHEGPAMTATQRSALIEIDDAGPLRLNDLAARIGTSAPTASRTVDALEELGLAIRTTDAEDRRAVRIETTPVGRELIAERKARASVAFGPAIDALPAADRAQLLRLLARVTAALSA
jgi:DNA-binding MarR family transcriptional regulator